MLLALLLLTGCVTSFRENHYFKSTSVTDSKATNYFRLQIEGRGSFSKARYLSGYFDERAVDLFFDELKTTQQGDIAPIFNGGSLDVGGSTLQPLSPDDQNGALMLIFSTNAKVVADTVGSFAESQVVADAITNLVNRGDVSAAARSEIAFESHSRQATAVVAELDSLFAGLPTNDPPDQTRTANGALRILDAIAAAQGRFGSFGDADEASAWFQAQHLLLQEDVR